MTAPAKKWRRATSIGRFIVGIEIGFSFDGWEITQARTGDRHKQLLALVAVRREGEPRLVCGSIGPLSIGAIVTREENLWGT